MTGATLTSGGGGDAAALVRPHPSIAEENTARSMNGKTLAETGPLTLYMRSVSPIEVVGCPAKEQKCKPWAKTHRESVLHKWLKCKEDLKDEMCRCMTSVEAVDLASTVLALRRIGHDQPLL